MGFLAVLNLSVLPSGGQEEQQRKSPDRLQIMDFATQASEARIASRELAQLTRAQKDAALHAMADALDAAHSLVLEANARDVAQAVENSTRDSLVDRIRLNEQRIAGMVQGLRDLAALSDPVGEVVRGWQLPNGVRVTQTRVPFGVVAMIYEARPNVTADASGICLKSGNAVLLRGSSSARESNRAIVTCLRAGLANAGINPDAISLVEGGREVTAELMAARGLVDVLIPRGGAGLIEAVVKGAKVPVIETGTGNCHLFVDASADLEMAAAIILNAKTQRPGVCNALETLLVHSKIADTFMPAIIETLTQAGVTLHGDPRACAYSDQILAAEADEFEAEYLSLDLAVKIVDSVAEAVDHIRTHTTGHSETIVTSNANSARLFTQGVDAAAVLVNASSRFVDGGEFGFGAEIGISTQKLHARGPMGLSEMTSTKYLIVGEGQVRA